MNSRLVTNFSIGVLIASVLATLVAWMALSSGDRLESSFGRQIDLSPLDAVAVQTDGRLKSFDSFAHEMMGYITGPKQIEITNEDGKRVEIPDDFAYFDLMLRPDQYRSHDIIYIKKKPMRGTIARLLEEAGAAPREQLDAFVDTGLISMPLLNHPVIRDLFDRWATDLIKTAKFVNQIESAMSLVRPIVLQSQLRMIPPPNGDKFDSWFSIMDLYSAEPGEPAVVESIGGMDQKTAAQLRNHFDSFARFWMAGEAQKANDALATFCSLLPEVNPDVYPSQQRLSWESLYFNLKNLTWIWVIYLVSVIFLLMSVAYRWDGARWIGLGAFSAAFLLHSGALALRWYVSGRWPNSNMFEAVTTSVWLGTLGAIAIELLARRTAMRSIFILSGAVASMAAMMSAHYIPRLDANIGNMMPVLHDLWLYIHTNVIIASYALIAMAAVTAFLYLGHRAVGGPPDYARAGGAASLVESSSHGGLLDGERRVTFGQMMDGATMILMELSFLLLWAGIVMGAIWADHSWGRPWGWDPKEVFALNTWLVFLILVHVRLRAKDKGLWTALLAVIGCGVMLFNWIVINFVITGLHSYA